jgi:hypothetical protein
MEAGGGQVARLFARVGVCVKEGHLIKRREGRSPFRTLALLLLLQESASNRHAWVAQQELEFAAHGLTRAKQAWLKQRFFTLAIQNQFHLI